MESDGYNGWSNYETWNCALWIGNDEWAQGEVMKLVEREGKEGIENGQTAGALRDWAEENMLPSLEASFASDMLSAAFIEIDFQEIAESFASDCEWEGEEE